MGTITHVATDDPVVALTFDDGPHPDYTPRLLKILAAHRASATFFMTGKAAQQQLALVRAVAEAGHAIGNHSWDHPSFPLISPRERRRQIMACQRALAPFGQRLFRPPYGEQSPTSRLDAWWLGYRVVGWNLDCGDWYQRDAGLMADWLERNVHPGAVVLLHDSIFADCDLTLRPKLGGETNVSREPMLTAVSLLLERVGRTFRFVTIPDLLRHGVPQLANWLQMTPPGR